MKSSLRSLHEEQIDRFKDRLKEAIGEESVRSFSRRCGISESVIRKYLAGSHPVLDKLPKIAEASGRSMEWLVTGNLNESTTNNSSSISTQAIDIKILETSIEAIELLCKTEQISMTISKKSKIIALVYAISLEDKKIDESMICKLLELAS